MTETVSRDNTVALAAIAAITGQTVSGATETFCAITESAPDQTTADAGDIS